ncbi:MAG: hypothetical protein HY870_24280, partial [Chloroflexi bacterium]|nr:hypothetical protein [Chloroflexota bacterium]
MRRLSAVTLDRFIRAVVSLTMLLSTIGLPSAVPVAQAKPMVESPQAPSESTAASSPAVSVTASVTDSVKATVVPIEEPIVTAIPPVDVTPDSKAIPVATPMPEVTATPEVKETPVPGAVQLTVDQAGGRLVSADKRIQLDVPSDLFKDQTQIKITPLKFET